MSDLVVCKICKELFDRNDTSSTHLFHTGSWAGFEKGKLYGTCTTDTSLNHLPQIVYQWDCCGSSDKNCPGCQSGQHESF
mmetsp:Transcript_21638/g.28014  ORF Transcript_21638/g.28014 Transcript_21638/m.28014 type:complete len:80 (-) Transcript_21638:359-598(-)